MGALEQALAKEAAKRGLAGAGRAPSGLGGLGKLGLAGVAAAVGVAGLGVAIKSALDQGAAPLKRLDQAEGSSTQSYSTPASGSFQYPMGTSGVLYRIRFTYISTTNGQEVVGGLTNCKGKITSARGFIEKYQGFDYHYQEMRWEDGKVGGVYRSYLTKPPYVLTKIEVSPMSGSGETFQEGGDTNTSTSSSRTTLAPGSLPDLAPSPDKNRDREEEQKQRRNAPDKLPSPDKQRGKDKDRDRDRQKFPGGDREQIPELKIPPPTIFPPPANPDISLRTGTGTGTGRGGSTKAPPAPRPPEKIPDLKGGDSSKIIDGKRLPTPDAITDREKAPNQSPIDPCIISSPCSTTSIKNTEQNLRDKLDDLYKGIDLTLLATINTKLGNQIPGGIGPFLQTFYTNWERFRNWIKLDRAINLLNLWINLHNAFMLSRNLADTLFALTDQFFSVFGVELKDDEGQSIGISNAIGNALESTAQRLVGVENWTNITETVAKANRIYQSASQIVWTVRSIQDSAREIAEWTAENTGKIGNALKKWRIVGEDAYKWMPEKIESQNAWMLKINRFRDQTEALEDAASSLSSVIGEVQSIQSEFDELKEQKDKFNENLEQFEPKERPDNVPVKDNVTESKTVSAAPTNIDVVFRGEGEESNAGT